MCTKREYWILIAALMSVVSASPLEIPMDFFSIVNLRRIQSSLTLGNLLTVDRGDHYAQPETTCSKEMMQYRRAIESGETWAMHMLDASSKIPSGILVGNLLDVGMYDQCVGVRPQENVTDIQGRHCMYLLNMPLATLLPGERKTLDKDVASKENTSSSTVSLTLSVCLPSSCGGEDVQQILKDAIEKLPILEKTGITVDKTTCSRVGPRKLGTGGVITITLLLVVVLFMISCTICDFIKGNSQDPKFRSLETLSEFSLYKNAKKLLNTKISPESYPFINGMRCLSMFMVICGHLCFTIVLGPLINTTDILRWFDGPEVNLANVMICSVDTFLVVSGFLLANNFIKTMRAGVTFSLRNYYIHRYIRLTPSAVVLILVSVYVVDHMGSGPLWDHMIGYSVQCCEDNWWYNLLYIQNFNGIRGCGIQMWYLAVEMQLFWLSPIILYPLYRRPRLGLAILAMFFAASIAIPAATVAMNAYSASFLRHDRSYEDNLVEGRNVYQLTHMRAAPWLIGVFLGYLIIDREKRINKIQLAVGWILTICATVFCLFTYRGVQVKNYKYDMVWEAVSISFTRPLWGAVVAWTIFVCTQGYGGPIARFFSHPIFVPLSKLSYWIYLIHFTVQVTRAASRRTTGYVSHMEMLTLFWFDLAASTVLAFIFSLFFESPIMVLENILKRGKRPSQNSRKSEKIQ